MTDITKCTGQNCPIKDKCYRYTAKESEYSQSWADFKYEDGKCEDFYGRSRDE
jgi:hypothetical protein